VASLGVWAAAVIYLCWRKDFGFIPVLGFAFVFLDLLLIKVPLPRNEELATQYAVAHLLSTGRIPSLAFPVAYESGSWPGVFIFAAIVSSVLGLSPAIVTELTRALLPLAASLGIMLLAKEIVPERYELAAVLAIAGSYGLTDIFQFTPLYFCIVLSIYMLTQTLRMLDRDRIPVYICAVALSVALLISHPIPAIVILGVALSIILFGKVVVYARITSNAIALSVLIVVATVAYEFFFANSGFYFQSGLSQLIQELQTFSLSSADISTITSHVQSSPWWSTLTIFSWAGLTLAGTFVAAWFFLKSRGSPFVLIAGLVFGVFLIQLLQSAQAGLPLLILTFVSPITLITLVKARSIFLIKERRRAKLLTVGKIGLACLLTIGIVTSFLSYNTVYYTQTAQSADISFAKFFDSHGPTVSVFFATYPSGPAGTNVSFVYGLGDANSTASLIHRFSLASNAVYYVNWDRTTLADEFSFGLNASQVRAQYNGLGEFDAVFSSYNSTGYYV
jgi:hypothetical protein